MPVKKQPLGAVTPAMGSLGGEQLAQRGSGELRLVTGVTEVGSHCCGVGHAANEQPGLMRGLGDEAAPPCCLPGPGLPLPTVASLISRCKWECFHRLDARPEPGHIKTP